MSDDRSYQQGGTPWAMDHMTTNHCEFCGIPLTRHTQPIYIFHAHTPTPIQRPTWDGWINLGYTTDGVSETAYTMKKVELWGHFPGGRNGKVHANLENDLRQLAKHYGPEAVVQVAVLVTGLMPCEERQIDVD